jgi:hypothetical protein
LPFTKVERFSPFNNAAALQIFRAIRGIHLKKSFEWGRKLDRSEREDKQTAINDIKTALGSGTAD